MNYPKDPNDWYFFLGAACSALGFGVAKNFPLPDYTAQAGFWIPQFFGAVSLIRWVGASVWSDVDRARTVFKMQLYKESIPTIEHPNPVPVDGFFAVNRPAVNAAKSAMVTNANTVEMPKLNLQSHFFTCVLRSYDLDPEGQSQVDMTEDTWVTRRKMFSQTPFANMKLGAEKVGAFRRKHAGKKSPFVVADRSILLHLTKHPLPQ